MVPAILGKKIGMTRSFTEDGKNIPITVIEAGPCVVTQVKTTASNGYSAVQLAFDDARPRRTPQSIIGHDGKAGATPKRMHREVRCGSDKDVEGVELGQTITVGSLDGTRFVDITGTSKGKGFQGSMVRHNYKGLCASHGTERKHRSPGSISSHGTDRGRGPKPKKGKGMAGHMGDARVTVRSVDVISIDPERNLLLVKGAVPGASNGYLFIRASKRLYKRKARVQAGK